MSKRAQAYEIKIIIKLAFIRRQHFISCFSVLLTMWFLFHYLWILFVYNISSWLYISFTKLHFNVDYLSDWLWNDFKEVDNVFDYIIGKNFDFLIIIH